MGVDLYALDWKKIATMFTDRDSIAIKNRYYSHIKKHNLMEDLLKLIPLVETAVQLPEIFSSDEALHGSLCNN